MKKKFFWITISSLLLLSACGSKDVSEKEQSKTSQEETEVVDDNKEQTKSPAVVEEGEEWVHEKDGKDLFSIKVSGVSADEEFDGDPIVVLEVEYKNIGVDGNFEASVLDFQVYDKNGIMLGNMGMSEFGGPVS